MPSPLLLLSPLVGLPDCLGGGLGYISGLVLPALGGICGAASQKALAPHVSLRTQGSQERVCPVATWQCAGEVLTTSLAPGEAPSRKTMATL